jgi:hypothetical protein
MSIVCPPNITKMMSITKLEHFDDVGFREVFVRIIKQSTICSEYLGII